MVAVGDVAALMERWAPAHLAEDGDNVGLLVGRASQMVDGIMVSLDVDEAAIARAKSMGIGLIVAHHPLVYSPLHAVTEATPTGRLVLQAAEAGIAVYAAHTNLDRAAGGVNDKLCEAIGLHAAQAEQDSIARVAELETPISLNILAMGVKAALNVETVRMTGDRNSQVKRVYVISGSGKRDIKTAVRLGADVMLTGELGYHDAQAALYSGLRVIEAGHYGSEYPILGEIEKHLQREFRRLKYKIRTVVYKQPSCPFWYV